MMSPQYTAYGGIPGYGAAFPKPGQKRKAKISPFAICQCLFFPWLMFVVLYAALSFEVRYKYPRFMHLTLMFCAFVTLAVGGMGVRQFLRNRQVPQPQGSHSARWYLFAFFSFVGAYMLAVVFGDLNYWYYLQPYYDVNNLQTYNSVDPVARRGNQLMDAGQVYFAEGSQLDLSKSMGFKNLDWYCVAPIVKSKSTPAVYDFWAVGINCCSGLMSDFMCGEYNNLNARAGLRLMRDDQRPFFRLTVQQAEAAFSIRAPHPLFFYWMQDPQVEMNTYRDDGFKNYLLGVFTYFGFNLFCVACAVILFSKMDGH
jgi:hypothetical protein